MARQTGRAPGAEDRGSFIRKGVAGDWVNHFTRETAELFDELAGDALVALGYESDRGWADRYDLPVAGSSQITAGVGQGVENKRLAKSI